MDISKEQRRRDFSVWLRTGRLPRPRNSCGLEVKFNPWHDPEDGRFTFSGAGRYYGPGGARRVGGRGQSAPKISYFEDLRLPHISSREEVEAWKAEQLAKHGHKPGYREAIEAQYRRYLDKLARRSDDRARAIGNPGRPDGQSGLVKRQSTRLSDRGGFSGGGGSFGGGGASGSWDEPAPRATPSAKPKPHHGHPGGSARAPAARAHGAGEQRHTIVRNGYTYELDARGRTRRVSGVLSDTDMPMRSRTNQAQAGGADRRARDDGGHYIAARFNGPTDAFNHFAQDANFNRGRYRVIEDQWARARRAGKKVTVAIVPHYHEGSTRPFEIDVSFTINGRKESVKMPNERTEKSLAK